MAEEKLISTYPFNHEHDFLDYAQSHGFGDLHFKVCPKTGMKAIIAIHNTSLGPALGGCRFIEYPNTQLAIYDVMRLARGMSYKAASVNLPLGGGKSVIIKPQGDFDRAGYFHRFGEFVEELGGRYITALDSGTELSDMAIIAEHTQYVASLPHQHGDPSPWTARGVLIGIEAAVLFKLGRTSLDGLHVAIQGLGHVGFALATLLHQKGARLTVADINPKACQRAQTELNARVVTSDEILKIECDVLAPCALGGVINDNTINEIKAPIIAGAANNQLLHAYHGQLLLDKDILYATDYVINAGGLIFAASKYLNKGDDNIPLQINHIGESLTEIFARAKASNQPTNVVADRLAEEKMGG